MGIFPLFELLSLLGTATTSDSVGAMGRNATLVDHDFLDGEEAWVSDKYIVSDRILLW